MSFMPEGFLLRFRCGACGCPVDRDVAAFGEKIGRRVWDAYNAGATRLAMICDSCEADPEAARARLLDPEPGMPIGAIPLTLAHLRFLKETLAKMRRNENIRAGSCSNLARCYRGHGTRTEDYTERAGKAREKVEACNAILPIITAALDAAEGGLETLGARINRAIAEATSFRNLDEEAAPRFDSVEEAHAALRRSASQTLDANAIPSLLNPAPDLSVVTVNCSGMVSPEGHLWHKVPSFVTVGGYHAYVYGPNCRAYLWDSDKGEMREFCVETHEGLALSTWRHYREKMEEVNAYQTQEPANSGPTAGDHDLCNCGHIRRAHDTTTAHDGCTREDCPCGGFTPRRAPELCTCGHVRREHEENDLAEPCDVHGCPCDGYEEVGQ